MHATALAMLVALSGPMLPPHCTPGRMAIADIGAGVTPTRHTASRALAAPIPAPFAGGALPLSYRTSAAPERIEAGSAPVIPPPIPLPPSAWLLLSGLLAMAGLKISRRSSSADTGPAPVSSLSLPGASAPGLFGSDA